jgi:Phosphodiester glycosidase
MSIIAVLFALACAATPEPATPQASIQWRKLLPGMEQASVPVNEAERTAPITVLRIDPHEWQLELAGSAGGDVADANTRSARDWARQKQFVAVINAGMFRRDYKTHVGFLQSRGQTSNSHANDYQSIAAFDPRNDKLPAFRIFDLDTPGVSTAEILQDYASAVQNLRLIKGPGVNQWPKQTRPWSEAALGEDDAGRILFIFCRAQLSMHDLNERLLSAGIGIVAAQHLEGGPEAQLYLHAGDMEHEWFGSYETTFSENEANTAAWPIPNVLGVRRRTP